jgi:SagB-type dehydrogenase family enzyme
MRRAAQRNWWGMLLAVCLVGCVTLPDALPAAGEPGTDLALPPPGLRGQMSLEEALAARRSIREFANEPLTLEELGQLAWSAQGITDARGLRTAPSAGALYPLELYIVLEGGVYRYEPEEHGLQMVQAHDARQPLYETALHQEAIRQAPAVFVLAAVMERTIQKYGAERSPRYVHIEVGHAAQNLLLQAVALGLGAVPIGAFHDDEVQRVLGLPGDHLPIYLIPVGHPSTAGG